MTGDDIRRLLPAVDTVYRHERLRVLTNLQRELTVRLIRQAIDAVRDCPPTRPLTRDHLLDLIVDDVLDRAGELTRPGPRRVVNATGVVLNTNLGRAPLSDAAVNAITAVAGHYCDLEQDTDTGERSSRYRRVNRLLTWLTGAEAALVVNNNAAAVLLALNTLARGREVVVSRGQLVEIGGSFRLPEIMAASGAILREVGTTNRTYARDYEQAITEDTAMLLSVHPSNFQITGYVSSPDLAELVEIGRRHDIPVLSDEGSGLFIDLSGDGITEHTVERVVATGVEIVTCSGDKLLGGPQAGLIVGRHDPLQQMKQNPLLRALRADKLTLAALEATLTAYTHPRTVRDTVPAITRLTMSERELECRASDLASTLNEIDGSRVAAVHRGDTSPAGGGSLPGVDLPTRVVDITVAGLGPEQLVRALRRSDPPVLVRVSDGRVSVDPRTLTGNDAELVVEAVRRIAELEGSPCAD